MNKVIFIVHPVVLFLLGWLISISPIVFGSESFKYYDFSVNYNVIPIYLLGLIGFCIGVYLIAYLFSHHRESEIITFYNYKNIVVFIAIFSFVVFLSIIYVYGGIPIFNVLSGDKNISYINDVQATTGGGRFGVFLLLVFSLIILLPGLFINKKNNSIVFFIVLFLCVLYVMYSGKRQMLFVLFTYTFIYLIIFYYRTKNSNAMMTIFKIGIVLGSIIVFWFVYVGLVRTNTTMTISTVFQPIVQYASLPFMNLTNIFDLAKFNFDSNSFHALFSFVLSDTPYIVRHVILSDSFSVNMPLIEVTAPSTVFGMVYWLFGFSGVFCFLFLVGMFVSFIYQKALLSRNSSYISMYSLCAWPLLSIHTYNHFISFMFFILPLLMIICGRFIFLNSKFKMGV
ncbi:O-antigen polymerase [Photobacterium phosphoreum]|uniref:O-antigen polymerase n=1 Tax=Photobacterium phosphoreum TaxID=659 RepID=UPI00242BE36D|nr:O-antigen ligase [Photobacterium phosphoreum]